MILSTREGPVGIPRTTRRRLMILSTTRRLLSTLSTTGPCVSTTSATVHISSPDRCTDHRPGTPDAALHLNRLDRAVEGTGSAFHAPCLVDELCRLFAFSKDPVGADLAAPPAVDTPLRIICKSILAIRVEHQATQRNKRARKRTARTIPHAAMATITLT